MDVKQIFREFEIWNKDGGFSGVFSIRERGAVVLEQAFGYADPANKLPNRPATKMGIASGTKLFTALTVMILCDRGVLSLDRKIGEILKIDLGLIDRAITVKQLLIHTSGIADYCDESAGEDYSALWVSHPANTMTDPAAFLPLFSGKPMKNAPGRITDYSNAGYILLGLVIEAATGMRYRETVAELVLKPCLLRETGFFYSDSLPPNAALGYFYDDERRIWRSNIFAVPIVGGPDGGIFTTAGDIARLWERFIEGDLVRPETRNAMLSPRTRIGGADSRLFFGLGLYLRQRDDNGYDFIIVGSDPGVEFFSLYQSVERRIVTAIGNTGKDTTPLLRKIRGD